MEKIAVGYLGFRNDRKGTETICKACVKLCPVSELAHSFAPIYSTDTNLSGKICDKCETRFI